MNRTIDFNTAPDNLLQALVLCGERREQRKVFEQLKWQRFWTGETGGTSQGVIYEQQNPHDRP